MTEGWRDELMAMDIKERLEGWIGEDNGVRVIVSVGQPINFQ